MGVKGIFDFFTACVRTNLQSVIEYRTNFIVQTLGMFVNDIAWLAFWMIFFAKFPNVNGWVLNDIVVMYAIITIGFGITAFIFGNWDKLSKIIINGELDYYLVLPKPVLLHVLVSRTEFSGAGDVLFGLVLFFFAVPLTIPSILLFITLLVMSSAILLHFAIIIGSLTFFIGGRGGVQDNMLLSVTVFGTYPFSAFEGATKFLLLTIIPVGFITGIPVQIMKNFSPTLMIYMILATITIICVAHTLFRRGLKRYESGNLINVRL